jgi:hypothetical protein
MLDPKVAEDALQAWEKFMRQVDRMQCRMLTAMADEIDKQWADMVAPVAIPANERHDAATCCGERQEPAKPVEIDGDKPDAGEKFGILHQGSVLRDGDEWAYISTPDDWSSIPKFSAGSFVRDSLISGKRYRRRLATPSPETPPSSWDEHRMSGAWRRKAYELADENAALRNEVERLRLRPEERRAIRNALSWMLPSSASFLLLESMLKRLGGGE